jgi:hypothetical protein
LIVRGGEPPEWDCLRDPHSKRPTPMLKIPFVTWIANAAAALTGTYGDVTLQAEAADCSRQTIYDHAHKVQAAVVGAYDGGPTRPDLIAENRRLARENAQLWDWLDQAIESPASKQHEFVVTAAAMGLSLNQALVLLALIVGMRACPGRPTLHRRIKLAGVAAGRVLKLLDARCRALVLVGCLDEIFSHGHPVLAGVEPASTAWFLGHKADDRSGATWAHALSDRDGLAFVTADAGKGLQAGIAAVPRKRQEDGKPSLENGLDVFHTTYEARRVLRRSWNRAGRLWEQAEVAGRRVELSRRQGRDTRGLASVVSRAWKQAEAAVAEYERSEAGWKIAHGALAVFGPEGRLNDRARASQQIALALPPLPGPEWSKVRSLLQAEGALTFLDRLHRQWGGAVAEGSLRAELVRLWWLRRRRPRVNVTGPVAGAGHVAHPVQEVVCREMDPDWREPYGAVSRVLRGTVRASSAVECMNSVLRMHQARHRTVSQGLPDLKRLYWNCREFREGKRRRHCPYELLGLKLPGYRFWDLLGMPTKPGGRA